MRRTSSPQTAAILSVWNFSKALAVLVSYSMTFSKYSCWKAMMSVELKSLGVSIDEPGRTYFLIKVNGVLAEHGKKEQ